MLTLSSVPSGSVTGTLSPGFTSLSTTTLNSRSASDTVRPSTAPSASCSLSRYSFQSGSAAEGIVKLTAEPFGAAASMLTLSSVPSGSVTGTLSPGFTSLSITTWNSRSASDTVSLAWLAGVAASAACLRCSSAVSSALATAIADSRERSMAAARSASAALASSLSSPWPAFFANLAFTAASTLSALFFSFCCSLSNCSARLAASALALSIFSRARAAALAAALAARSLAALSCVTAASAAALSASARACFSAMISLRRRSFVSMASFLRASTFLRIDEEPDITSAARELRPKCACTC